MKSNLHKSDRLLYVDGFRGFCVLFMIFTDNIGATWPILNTSPWSGIHFADFIQPFFLYIVGLSLVLSIKNSDIFLKYASKRFLKLCIIGLLTEGGQNIADYNLKYLRFFGILQRIAICYIFGVLLELYLSPLFRYNLTPSNSSALLVSTNISQHKDEGWKQRWIQSFSIYRMYQYHWCIFGILLIVYTSIVYSVDIPMNDICHETDSSPACNSIGYIDTYILGANHVYFPLHNEAISFQRTAECSACSPGKCAKENSPNWCNNATFEPYGIMSTFTSICTTIFGMHAAHLFVSFSESKVRIFHLIAIGFIQIMIGLLLEVSTFSPLNANLYSISYLFVTAGVSSLVLSFLYWMMEKVAKYRMKKKRYKYKRLRLAKQYLNNFNSPISNKLEDEMNGSSNMEEMDEKHNANSIQSSYIQHNEHISCSDDINDDNNAYGFYGDDDDEAMKKCCPFWCCCCCEDLPITRWDMKFINIIDKLCCFPLESLGRNALIIYIFAVSKACDWIFAMFYWNEREECIKNYLWPTGIIWGPTSANMDTDWFHSSTIMLWTLTYCFCWTLIAIFLNHKQIYYVV